jgi:GT2 family glycosyltransferase
VIAFLVAIADQARWEAIAQPALARVREGDSLVVTVPGGRAPQLALNDALDELAGEADLEAVVILHEDVALLDVNTAAIVRAAFADPQVAIAGVIGVRGVTSLAWWDTAATAIGRAGTPHMPGGATTGATQTGDVDALDGIVLCLSPWAVRTLRFDEELAADFHGYDVDLCFQARYHGRRVTVIELTAHHEHRPLMHDSDRWVRNELRFQRQWIDHRMITERRHQALSRAGGQAPERPG